MKLVNIVYGCVCSNSFKFVDTLFHANKTLAKFLFLQFIKLKVITVDLQWLEHLWLINLSYLEVILESLGKNPMDADLG